MAKGSGTNGAGSGTGQDTHKVCVPVPPPLPATPCGTRRDIVPSCPACPTEPKVPRPSLAGPLCSRVVLRLEAP